MIRMRLAALAVLLATIPMLAISQEKKDPNERPVKTEGADPKAKAEPKKEGAPEPKKELTREQEMKGIERDFMQARGKAIKAMRAAKTPEERKAGQELLPKEKDFLPRIHALLEKNDGDESAIMSLTLATFAFQSKDPKVVAALEKNIKNPKIRVFAEMSLGGAPDNVKPILEKILKDNPDKGTQGIACYSLANMLYDDESENQKDHKGSEVLFARIEKEFADVKAGQGTLGEMAKSFLYEIRYLGIGMKAPEAGSKNLKGDKDTIAAYKGKVVILDFWATWCGPCRAMIPHEREMVEMYKDKPFVFISLSADDEKKDLEDFLKEEKMPWVHWWDGREAEIIKNWNIRFFPTIYVIDAAGVIRYKNIRGPELDKAVAKLVAEAEKK